MNPEYGSDIRSFLFEPLDYGTCAELEQSIKYCIDEYEPSITIEELDCIPNFDDNGFDVEMSYSIRGSDNPPTTVDFFLARTR